ncbi:MAG: superoxide dismutase [Pseudomonadales bacterium]|nr:superoxide dismutase [Pseudomonadales bacterium]MBL6808732.1 superoxide dismutase [Pseudomonadales bacterium]
MAFELPALPYARDALAPHISAETIDFHYGKHHQTYVDKLNAAVEGKPEANATLEELIKTSTGGVFNNAAQIWNHTFYWNSLSPNGGGAPSGALAEAIDRDLGGLAACKQALADAVGTHFGSGWAWLVLDNGELKVESLHDAGNPMTSGQTPLLTIDAWEHAFYIDYRNAKPKYCEAVLEHLINWSFAEANFANA